MNKRTIKALININDIVDEHNRNLYDIIKDQKCCIRRQMKLLKDIRMSINSNSEQIKSDYAYFLVNLISRELNYPLYRVKGRKNG